MLPRMEIYGPAGTTVGRTENYRQQNQGMSLDQGPFSVKL
jgi:hypothetical protein